jgi:hypothetical protein
MTVLLPTLMVELPIVLERGHANRKPHWCREPGCGRIAVSFYYADSLCSKHDGRNEPTLCICDLPQPDRIHMCGICYRLVDLP